LSSRSAAMLCLLSITLFLSLVYSQRHMLYRFGPAVKSIMHLPLWQYGIPCLEVCICVMQNLVPCSP